MSYKIKICKELVKATKFKKVLVVFLSNSTFLIYRQKNYKIVKIEECSSCLELHLLTESNTYIKILEILDSIKTEIESFVLVPIKNLPFLATAVKQLTHKCNVPIYHILIYRKESSLKGSVLHKIF